MMNPKSFPLVVPRDVSIVGYIAGTAVLYNVPPSDFVRRCAAQAQRWEAKHHGRVELARTKRGRP